jgi:hypothetical protein
LPPPELARGDFGFSEGIFPGISPLEGVSNGHRAASRPDVEGGATGVSWEEHEPAVGRREAVGASAEAESLAAECGGWHGGSEERRVREVEKGKRPES